MTSETHEEVPDERSFVDEEAEVLDARLRAEGMYTVADLIKGGQPLDRWRANTSVVDEASFEAWLVRRYREMLIMRAGYDLGDKAKDDGLYEWVRSHAASLGEVLCNWRASKEKQAEKRAET